MIESESDLYQKLAEWTGEWFFYERIEPSNESGFPDVYFVVRSTCVLCEENCEGTIELKYFKPKEKLDLGSAKTKGTQKAALINYFQAGGKRRWFMAYHDGVIHIWPTHTAVKALMNHGDSGPHRYTVDDNFNPLHFRRWFLEVMTCG